MSSNTQNNTDRPSGTNTASTGNTASGLRSTEFGANTERTGYDSSPLTQQQHVCQGTSPFGEEDMEGGVGQKQYGRGQGGIGTGVGHHKSHQEGSTYLGQDTGVGGGDMKTTTDSDTFPRPTEQTTQAYSGVAGDPSAGATTTGCGTGTQAGHAGDTTGRYAGDPTTGSGTGTDNQYPITAHHGEGHHHKHHLGGSHSQEATGTGAKPSMTDKIIGGAEKVAGRVTSNTEMYQRGEERAAGETAKKNY